MPDEPPTPKPSDTFKGRVNVLLRRAKPDRGNIPCPFCGKGYFGPARFRRHLKYAHTPTITAMPAAEFD